MSASTEELILRPYQIPNHLRQYFEPALCSSCYMCHTIAILREVKRVLRKDGVVFWNIGDSYSGSGQGGGGGSFQDDKAEIGVQRRKAAYSLKPKDLCLIPFRVAIAAQEDGWWVRSVIIWSKPNPMPESVTDRPTESHEYILLLTKSGTKQYWTHRDSGGTREKPKADYKWVNQLTQDEVAVEPPDWKQKIKCPNCEATGKVSVHLGLDVYQETQCSTCNGKKETQLWKRINLWRGHDYYWDADAVREPHTESTLQRVEYGLKHRHPDNVGIGIPPVDTDRMGERFAPNGGRNIRSVWEFPTQPYPEAHFAVFPEKLPELCIKAATPEVGCCSKCGAPWERITKQQIPEGDGKFKYNSKFSEVSTGLTPQGFHRTSSIENERSASRQDAIEKFPNDPVAQQKYINQIHDHGGIRRTETLGWQPTCKCNADKVPSIVLDPFAGAGTTLWVAKNLNRRAVGYEISEEYCRLTTKRLMQQVMPLKTARE